MTIQESIQSFGNTGDGSLCYAAALITVGPGNTENRPLCSPNVYAEILAEEAAGNVIIHRYAALDPAEQKMHANYIRDHLNDPLCAPYREFLYQHFSPLWD